MSRNTKIALLIILSLVFVGEAAAAAIIVLHHSKNHTSGADAGNTQANTTASRDACRIFTLADAKQILSGNVAGGVLAVNGTSKDVQVSGCSYKLSNNTTAANSASLIVHRPKTPLGILGNEKIFGSQLPPGAQAVTGYGDKAYWDGQLGQLDILKDNVWYVLTYGAATPAGRSLVQTRTLADTLKDKL